MDKKSLDKAVTYLVRRLEKTEKFALAQAPDICKQMVQEAMIEAYSQFAGSTLLLLAGLILMAVSYHNISPSTRWDDQPWAFGFFIAFFPILGGLTWLGNTIHYYLYLKLCPKLFLLRQFKKLVK